MIKVITPSAWNFDEPIAQLVKVAKSGLRGGDLRSFIKRAGHKFADEVQNIDLSPGEVPVHLIALGATEYYGPNRNGDGFTEDTCRKHHSSFQKNAHWYRNHKNKDSKKSYGIVKLSHYNDDMKRVELIIALNSTKEAADRNGGLVASDEMEKLAKGEDIAVSMACRVPFDVCSGCGNRARSRNDYCNGALCKHGGLKSNIGTVLEDGHILHADNPDPDFFDISRVFRPADRIAYTLGRLEKAAAAGQVISGAELAEEFGLDAPAKLSIGANRSTKTAQQILCAHELAVLEQSLPTDGYLYKEGRAASMPAPPVVQFVTTTKLAHLVRALSQEEIILPVEEFLTIIYGDTEKAASVATEVENQLPRIYTRLTLDRQQLESDAASNPYFTDSLDTPSEYRKWAAAIAPDYSYSPEHVTVRAQRATLRGLTKTASVRQAPVSTNNSAEQLARQYALYKIASLLQFPAQKGGSELTLSACIMQNYI